MPSDEVKTAAPACREWLRTYLRQNFSEFVRLPLRQGESVELTEGAIEKLLDAYAREQAEKVYQLEQALARERKELHGTEVGEAKLMAALSKRDELLRRIRERIGFVAHKHECSTLHAANAGGFGKCDCGAEQLNAELRDVLEKSK